MSLVDNLATVKLNNETSCERAAKGRAGQAVVNETSCEEPSLATCGE